MIRKLAICFAAFALVSSTVQAETVSQKIVSVVKNRYFLTTAVVAGFVVAFPKLYKMVTGKKFDYKLNIKATAE